MPLDLAPEGLPDRPTHSIYLLLCASLGREPTEAELNEVLQAVLRGVDEGMEQALDELQRGPTTRNVESEKAIRRCVRGSGRSSG